MRQPWTKERVLVEIQRLYKREGRINSMFAQTEHSGLYNGACNNYGSWEKAVTAAGFNYSDVKAERPIYWSEECVKKLILKVYKTDRKINSNHVQINHRALYGQACRRFGSWKAAVAAAGLDYDAVRISKPFRAWSKEVIVAEIKRRRDEGLPLSTMAVIEEDRGLLCAAQRYFGAGGWQIALTLAGLDPKDVTAHSLWKKGKVIEEIKRLASLNIPLYGNYLVNNGHKSLFTAGCNRFGTWKAAIEAAGFDYEKVRANRHNYWTKERVVAEIKRLAQAGTPLSFKSVQGTRADLTGAAIKCFGNWSEAVAAAGLDYDKIKLARHYYWTKDKILDEIRNLDKAGMRLNSQAIKRKRGDLWSSASVFFGTWSQAVEDAGINYLEHCMVWSTKAWLRKLTRADVERLEQRADELTELKRQNERKKK